MLIHNADITGSLLVNGTGYNTGSFSGSFTGAVAGTTATASYVEYNNVANKPALVSGSSQITYSGLTGIPSGIVSGSSQVTYSGLTGIPSGIVSGSAQVAGFGIFATTGSNQFNGSQVITGSLTTTGTIVAQTLNVQQVTSSIVFSSGSNIFGNSVSNTQQFTGSVGVTGSLTVTGTTTASDVVTILKNQTGNTNTLVISNPSTSGTFAASAMALQSYNGTSTVDVLTISATSNTWNYQAYGANSGIIYAGGTGGLKLFAGNASGTIGFYTAGDGTGNERLTISSTGAATFSNSVTATGGLISNGGSIGYGGGELGFNVTTSGATSGIYTTATGSPILYFDHRATGNTGFWVWRSGTGGGTTALTLSNVGAATFGSSVTAGGNVLVPAGSGLAWSGDASRIITPEDNVQGAKIVTPGGFLVEASVFKFTGGNVGIGTTAPAEKLTVYTGTNYAAAFNTTSIESTTTRISLGALTTSGGGTGGSAAIGCEHYHAGTSNSSLLFYTYGGSFAERMRISPAGNVGIGTTSPDAIFHVARANSGGVGGQVVIDNPASSALGNTSEISFLTDVGASGAGTRNGRILAVNENVGNGAANMQFHTWDGSASAERMRITSTGTVQPGANGTQDLGTSSLRWATVYTSDLSLSNGIGDYTIVEGEHDLFLYNNKNNKVYKFLVEEVDPSTATPKKS